MSSSVQSVEQYQPDLHQDHHLNNYCPPHHHNQLTMHLLIVPQLSSLILSISNYSNSYLILSSLYFSNFSNTLSLSVVLAISFFLDSYIIISPIVRVTDPVYVSNILFFPLIRTYMLSY